MSDQYVGEVRLVGFNFAPIDWALCNGQQISIAENSVLFNLIGTTYGGNGTTTYNLPNLQGRIPIHQGSNGTSNYIIGQTGGVENVTINSASYPAHSHALNASSNVGALGSPAGNVLGEIADVYSADAPTNPMSGSVLGASPGGNLPHNNLQPYVVLNWIIALYGIYPSQN
jgi:microcystin-dependent protein